MSISEQVLPQVQVLTMGGTIAGAAASATSASYQAGAKSGSELLASVPGLASLARIRVQDVVAKDSSDLEFSDWWLLLAAVRQAVADPGVSAVVITHGTDTMEETAYFLSLVIEPVKPVVLVGAMRPATALSADGPLNLYNAVAVSVDPQTQGRGVLVVMNDRIFDARQVTKSHTTAVDAFRAPNTDAVGAVTFGWVRYSSPATSPAASRSPAWNKLSDHLPGSLTQAPVMPRVDILYLHAAMSIPEIKANREQFELKGLVLAGTGAGNVPSYLKAYLDALQARGVVIVRASRVWAGGAMPDYQQIDSAWGLVGAGVLSPHKARILLMLALRVSDDPAVIRQYFADA